MSAHKYEDLHDEVVSSVIDVLRSLIARLLRSNDINLNKLVFSADQKGKQSL
jgi:hypothetical protein